MKNIKCDVIIPVYNAPEYVDMCVFALINNTKAEDLGTIYLLDDNSNIDTQCLVDNLQKKYSDKIKAIHNKENLGFIKNVNQGMKLCKEKYVLLLNTDCFIANNTIGKLMAHMESNPKIGLICPVCSNAANLTLEMFPGFSYTMMDELLERKFKGINYDACTVVGMCLMISKECIDKVGYLDEIYGMGYGDETDYQFKSMKAGFEAKVALDTYVFHKSEMSFSTTNKSRNERIEKNRKIFFDRWGDDYNKLLAVYNKNDPIQFIKKNLTPEDKIPNLDFTFVLPQVGKGAGGVILVIQLINYLSILGLKINMLNLYPGEYDGIMNFNSLGPKEAESFKSKYLIGTIFDSIFFAEKLAQKINSKIIYFSQGYEYFFLKGNRYGEVETTFLLSDYVITISDYLRDSYKNTFGIDAIEITNGIDYNLLHRENYKNDNERISVFMNLRDEVLKGGFILNDIIKKLTVEFNNIDIRVLDNSKKNDFCINNNKTVNIEYIKGPISRSEIYDYLRKSDILVDSSLSEGFGLLPLEAMTLGVVPVVSNALGNSQYCIDRKNSLLIDEVNNSDKYIAAIKELIEDKKLMSSLRKNAIETSKKYAFDDTIKEYYEVLEGILSGKIKSSKRELNKQEKEKVSKYLYTDKKYNRLMFSCKNNYYGSKNGSTRKHNFKVIAKEFVKANYYLLKQLIKTIRHRDHKI
jgi:GT2 family glycosyltransferase